MAFDSHVADIHAEWHAGLHCAGNIIGANDLMIAATALAHQLTVVTHNTDEFRRIDELTVDDWQD